MYLVPARNVNDAYSLGLSYLHQEGVRRPSRNGEVLKLRRPLTTHYEQPRERVLFDPTRNANPFFHLMEALWMLGGRNDVAWISTFLPKLAEYSDNGRTFHGAYGYRWRSHFGVDQLEMVIRLLRNDPDSRQAIISMWGAATDCGFSSKDLPCNCTVKVMLDEGLLNMIVFNRSNDLIWGCYGANVVQFSMLQEYLAARLFAEVGWYEQVSGDAHVYRSEWERLGYGETPPGPASTTDYYDAELVRPYPLMQFPDAWDDDLRLFLDGPSDTLDGIWNGATYENPFFHNVAVPLRRAYLWRRRDPKEALSIAASCHASDWRMATMHWLYRAYPSQLGEEPSVLVLTERHRESRSIPAGEVAP